MEETHPLGSTRSQPTRCRQYPSPPPGLSAKEHADWVCQTFGIRSSYRDQSLQAKFRRQFQAQARRQKKKMEREKAEREKMEREKMESTLPPETDVQLPGGRGDPNLPRSDRPLAENLSADPELTIFSPARTFNTTYRPGWERLTNNLNLDSTRICEDNPTWRFPLLPLSFEAMANRLGAISHILHRKITPNSRLILARPVSTIQKPESDLFKYTPGRWIVQNYGDEISESLQIPTLPSNFDELEEFEQFKQAELLRRRQLHYHYVKQTAEKNPQHYEALTYDFSTLRRRLYDHASDPWEVDNMTLKADLVTLSRNWSGMNRDAKAACPISFSDDESTECLRLVRAQSEADEQFKACLDGIGVGGEGWVPIEHYDEARRRERKLKAAALDAAETEEERARVQEDWIFDGFCEEDYM
ncbi:uncharacterized protein N7515_001544 [Penicillium bovifimosum]|uniref:Uncharacterized protein n=1 Tax=Penicillium bovifimosum TaxID=126998 RepID=A0A9W9L8V8_9EURO|nr:uncharacterized protein N7515_001544 [Penicillium bovifimosum]KAJ5142757.1 hypothetical protein N7515_001544 [Penicillium bovifimosum]